MSLLGWSFIRPVGKEEEKSPFSLNTFSVKVVAEEVGVEGMNFPSRGTGWMQLPDGCYVIRRMEVEDTTSKNRQYEIFTKGSVLQLTFEV